MLLKVFELIRKWLGSFIGVILLLTTSAVCAESLWPNPLILSGDMINAPKGAILHRVHVNQTYNATKLLSGTAYLSVKPVTDVGMADRGVFSISENNDIGVAFVGNLTISVSGLGSGTNTAKKNQWDDSLDSVSSNVSDKSALIRAKSPNAYLGKTTINVSGEVLIVKLSEAPISSKILNLPNVRLVLASDIIGGWEGTDIAILSTNSSAVNGQRSCQIFANGTTINFGTYKGNVATGELARNKMTEVYVSCSGVGTQDTNVILSIDSPTEGAGGDASAIGMQFSGVTSSNLVVKAKFDPSSSPSCSSSSGWINLSQTHSLATYKASNETSGGTYPIYWSLCRKSTQTLPVGRFEGSATLSVTFN